MLAVFSGLSGVISTKTLSDILIGISRQDFDGVPDDERLELGKLAAALMGAWLL